MVENKYVISLSDLRSGAYTKEWSVNSEFFKEFENEQIRSASLKVKVFAVKAGASVDVDLELKGSLVVPCDRCLEDVEMAVDQLAEMKIRFTEQSSGDIDEEDGRELIFLSAGESEFDLTQAIYDYSCLSLPILCCHRDGECNPKVMDYLNPSGEESVQHETSTENNPFASLKGLFNKD